jgi:Tol biopolymer transport system component
LRSAWISSGSNRWVSRSPSPDGGRLAFSSNRTGHYDLYVKLSTGNAPETLLAEFSQEENRNIEDWSPDGRFVLYSSVSPQTSRDIWAVPLEGDRKSFVLAQTRFLENAARFSPDGRWITYESNETGRNEIYVQRFPGSGGKWQISTTGGTNAKWRGNGREIFFAGPDSRLMTVAVTLPAEGTNVQPGVPVPLFTLPADSSYDVTPDGQRFLVNVPISEATVPPITVVLNWRPPIEK